MKDGWGVEKIGDVFETGAGGTPLKAKKANYENGTIPWLLSGEVNQRFITNSKNFITQVGLEDSSAKLFPENTVLVAMYGATAGQVGLLKFECCTNQAVCGILPNSKVIPDFLYYYLLSKKEDLIAQAVGNAQPNISQAKVKATSIPLPPLPEQKRIVAILDQAFKAINQAEANIERNIANAEELWQSKLNKVFSQDGVGWEEKTLIELTDKIGSGATPRGGQASYKDSGISLIRSMNVHDEGFRKKKLAFIDEEQAAKLNNVTVENGDVLLNITGASVARCCVMESEILPARVNQHVSIIRPKKGRINSQFLHYALTCQENKKKLLGIGEQGATRQAITKAQIQTFKISFPKSIEAQERIIIEINETRKMTGRIVDILSQKIASTEELKKSILQKAFSGELTEKEVVV